LGATLYYTLTGRTLYTGASPQDLLTKHLKGRYVSPKKYNPRISGNTLRILRKMLSVNREKRFQTMGQVIAAIERPMLRYRMALAALAVLLAALLFFLGALLQRFFHIF
jgi:serine/threonine protein kinase